MAQISHNAVTPVRLETDKKVGPDKDPNCLAFLVGVQRSNIGFWMTIVKWAMWWNDQKKYRAFFHSVIDMGITSDLALSAE